MQKFSNLKNLLKFTKKFFCKKMKKISLEKNSRNLKAILSHDMEVSLASARTSRTQKNFFVNSHEILVKFINFAIIRPPKVHNRLKVISPPYFSILLFLI